MRAFAAVLAAAGVAFAVAPAHAGAPAKAATAKRTVQVLDYYFSPAKMTVKAGTIVTWRWPAAGGDAHDVVLRKGPRRARKFASEVLVAGERFRQRLRVPGRYLIVCTLHEDAMRQTIVVKR